MTAQYAEEAKALTSFKGLMGPRGTGRRGKAPSRRGRGLGPQSRRGRDLSQLRRRARSRRAATARRIKVPENKAFWSITVYGADGYMKSDNNILNSSTVKLNADGTFTAFSDRSSSAATRRTDSTSRPAGTL